MQSSKLFISRACRLQTSSISLSRLLPRGRFLSHGIDSRSGALSRTATTHLSPCSPRGQARFLSTTDYVTHKDPTIFALSTAPGRAAIAIVRCSGSACQEIYRGLCPSTSAPKPRQATLRKLTSPGDPSAILDPAALVLYFPAPNTVTGEDVIEFHLHGGRATVRAILSAISTISSDEQPIRPAEPGEFTQRAFYNGRMDLTQVESLGDTLAAETETQRALASKGAAGSSVLRDRYQTWRDQLLQARGELEALIDFSEDQHFDESPAELAEGVAEKVRLLLEQVDASIQNAARGELLRNGIKIALLGAPNVGKSSLLNRIVGRDAAIVSSTAGTTRDIVETNVDINGFFCNFGDLAGIRASGSGPENEVGEIEQEGIKRAKARALDADVVIVVRDLIRLTTGETVLRQTQEVDDVINTLDLGRQELIHVVNKADLLPTMASESYGELQSDHNHGPQNLIVQEILSKHPQIDSAPICLISCKETRISDRQDGIQNLLETLTNRFRNLTDAIAIPGLPPPSHGHEESLGASDRQARLLEQCREHLNRFLEAVDVNDDQAEEEIDIVIAAEHLREAARCFAKMTGQGDAGDVEDVLGVVFEKFCVGK